MPSSEPRARTEPFGPLVVADIGGTNARFGWVERPGRPADHIRCVATSDFEGPAQAMRHYLDGLPLEVQQRAQRDGLEAGWALATTVNGDEVAMTNNRWRFSRRQEATALGLAALHVFNDLEALACSLPHLGAHQVRSWDERLPTLDGALAVIGSGTGLGVAGMVPAGSGWQALPGEGGHATLSAHDDFEESVLRQARGHWPHVSAERLLSGIGLPLLHECVGRASGWQAHALSAEDVVERGLRGDSRARRTLEVFCAMLGSFAGNVALVLGARGGVFIGGGLVPRLGELFFTSDFRRRFEDKGRFANYLSRVPTVLIQDTTAALHGVSAAVAALPPHRSPFS